MQSMQHGHDLHDGSIINEWRGEGYASYNHHSLMIIAAGTPTRPAPRRLSPHTVRGEAPPLPSPHPFHQKQNS
jgi:hypothetical protein